jgi:hypothetical protein
LLGALLFAGACGGGDAQVVEPGGGAGASGAGGSSGTQEEMTAGGTSGATGDDDAGAGPLQCPEDQSPASCGGNACAAVAANLALACVQGCCTAGGTCGTFNAAAEGPCLDVSGGSGHMCPSATVFDTDVPGCCVEGGNACGVVDLTGILAAFAGGDSQGCVPRTAVPPMIAELEPLSCDGTPVANPNGANGTPASDAGAPDAGAN